MKIAASLTEKSALKNFGISKPYRQQMVGVRKGQDLLRYPHFSW